MTPSYHDWLQQEVTAGEVVGIIKTTKGSKYYNTWATYELTPATIEGVTSTHVKAGGQMFRKERNSSGIAGEATNGDRIIPHSAFHEWELKIRLHTARNMLKDATDTQTRWLLTTLSDLAISGAFTEPLVVAVEQVVNLRQKAEEEAKFAAALLKDADDAYWKRKRSELTSRESS